MQKYFISIILLISFCVSLRFSYSHINDHINHLLFSFSHYNIFHLICNLIALYSIKGKLHIAPAFVIAILASYLDVSCMTLSYEYSHFMPTCGFSAVIFAIIGIRWGEWLLYNNYSLLSPVMFRRFFFYTIAPLIITMFIPHVNGLVHSFALCIGMCYGAVITKFKQF